MLYSCFKFCCQNRAGIISLKMVIFHQITYVDMPTYWLLTCQWAWKLTLVSDAMLTDNSTVNWKLAVLKWIICIWFAKCQFAYHLISWIYVRSCCNSIRLDMVCAGSVQPKIPFPSVYKVINKMFIGFHRITESALLGTSLWRICLFWNAHKKRII